MEPKAFFYPQKAKGVKVHPRCGIHIAYAVVDLATGDTTITMTIRDPSHAACYAIARIRGCIGGSSVTTGHSHNRFATAAQTAFENAGVCFTLNFRDIREMVEAVALATGHKDFSIVEIS